MGVFYIKADSGKVAVLRRVEVATRFGAGRAVKEETGAEFTNDLVQTFKYFQILHLYCL